MPAVLSHGVLDGVDQNSLSIAIVKQGIENVRLYGDSNDPLYEVFVVLNLIRK